MSQFSRRARWLNTIFPQSVAPATSDPGIRSDDVSLVQQYDAGGFIARKENCFFGADSIAGAAISTEILTVPDDEIFRLIAGHVFTVIAATPQGAQFVVIDLDDPTANVASITLLTTVPAVGGGNLSMAVFQPIVLAPGTTLRGTHVGGDANTVTRWRAYGFPAPFGSHFST